MIVEPSIKIRNVSSITLSFSVFGRDIVDHTRSPTF